jgi:serine protease
MPGKRSRGTLLFAALLAPASAPLWAGSAPATADAGTARVIVKFRAGSSLVSARALSPTGATAARARALGVRLALPMSAGATVSDLTQVVFVRGVTSAELAERLAQESDVEYAVPDERRRIVGAPNDPLYAAGVAGNGPAVGQWYLRAPSGDVQSSVNIEAAWAVTTGSPDMVVAVVDTGVRYEHPDLLPVGVGGHLLPGYDMTSDPDVANDGDGRDADPSDPGDWVTQAEISRARGTARRSRDSSPRSRTTASAWPARRPASTCCPCASSASAAATTRTSSRACAGPPAFPFPTCLRIRTPRG